MVCEAVTGDLFGDISLPPKRARNYKRDFRGYLETTQCYY